MMGVSVEERTARHILTDRAACWKSVTCCKSGMQVQVQVMLRVSLAQVGCRGCISGWTLRGLSASSSSSSSSSCGLRLAHFLVWLSYLGISYTVGPQCTSLSNATPRIEPAAQQPRPPDRILADSITFETPRRCADKIDVHQEGSSRMTGNPMRPVVSLVVVHFTRGSRIGY